MTEEELKQRAIDLYKPPFKFIHGYIQDADGRMVADDDGVSEGIIARVRGWGRIKYLPTPEQLQDQVGAMIAEALTQYWQTAIALRGGILKCERHGGYGFTEDCQDCRDDK